jgi:hypothetical protein
MYFTSQPLEITDAGALETTFRMLDAPNRLLYSSDHPQWDFDVPARLYDLPFLAEDEKPAILGGDAQRLFGLPEPARRGTSKRRSRTGGRGAAAARRRRAPLRRALRRGRARAAVRGDRAHGHRGRELGMWQTWT